LVLMQPSLQVLVRITNSNDAPPKRSKTKNGKHAMNGTAASAAAHGTDGAASALPGAAGEHMLALTALNAIDLPALSMFVSNQAYVKATILRVSTEDTIIWSYMYSLCTVLTR
jgi:hypothetical protein